MNLTYNVFKVLNVNELYAVLIYAYAFKGKGEKSYSKW